MRTRSSTMKNIKPQLNMYLSLAFVLFSACSPIKKDQVKDKDKDLNEQKFVAKDLKNQPLEFVLREKYIRADLVCSLWSQPSQSVDTNLSANDTNFINIQSTLASSATLTLSANIGDGLHFSMTKITINSVHIVDQVIARDFIGQMFLIEYTPVLKLTIEHAGYNMFSKDDKPNRFKIDTPLLNAYEKLLFIPVNTSFKSGSNLNNEVFFTDFIKCEFKTDVFSPYLDQFDKVENP